MEDSSGLMETFLKASSKTVALTAKANIPGRMGEYTKENGKTIK
jgi:hypothetical protein